MDTASLGRGDGPVVRHNHALVFVAAGHDVPGVDNGDILLVIGGSTHWAYLGDVWVFDLKTGSWTQMIPGGPGPVARHGHVAALVGSTVVVFGGHSGMQSRPSTLTYYNDVFSLDLTSWNWTRCATTLSTPRSWMGVAVVGALVVVAGGYTFDVTARDEVYFDVIEAYDVANDVFLSLPPDVTLASPRNRVCMASCASTIVIFGGNALLADRGDVFFSDIAVLDASSTCVSNWTLSVAKLTLSGWTSDFMLLPFLIMIRNVLLEGGALIDMDRAGDDYTQAEAEEAFIRVAKAHGWIT
ncbi:uncharacterized protein AMSG_11902 [Thecamonas trahens ATCC 50062]|uniref:Kelch repeat protein n=1 Tax=Thecamonas trahens ATCC 50062 TaxID=461836 RepID=A0A0L0DBE4_THETB|nr:hypothetical protein AMSG_11902 [Thecamonas trahens ATCC 50062]KNC49652.1 hypothetical protein AMSG_11902 [Thecamonas trahens ATCC 50062]|eukprot:XP_013757776.1 hypothetical protein AMSG_11902 [Thecamonas trahens ATCC 50062]